MTARLICAALLVLCTAPPAFAANELAQDLSARRQRLMARLGPETIFVLMSAPERNYSQDVNYEYRQDSNFYYLTGIARPNTMLVLMPGNATHREVLFVPDRDPLREHYSGRRLSHEEATERSGIAMVLSTAQFEPFIAAMFTGQRFGAIDDREAAAFFAALEADRARLALALEPRSVNGVAGPILSFGHRLRERFSGFRIVDALPDLVDLRLVKTPQEQRFLMRSLEIAAEAHLAGMRAARPGAYEYEVKAAIEAMCRARGAVSWSFPAIVASGQNATILHYPESDRRLEAGDLMLVDAACNYEYMSGDLTRTYPVSGRFSVPQREIYALVLEAQEAAKDVARPGATLTDVHQKAVDVIRAGLLRLGLITDATGDQYRMWFTHLSVHYIGIDVHDPGDNGRPLQPGMAFVIEPGVYVRQEVLDGLFRTPEDQALAERIQPAVNRYRNIGVRIEDAYLLRPDGLHPLTSAVPRTIQDIERHLR